MALNSHTLAVEAQVTLMDPHNTANLAVINFLPIPVLDGGHMAFLLYEKVRGRPAPEQLRVAATFLGVALIVSLMLFVTYLDFKKL